MEKQVHVLQQEHGGERNKVILKIEAVPPPMRKKRLKVAAYCRVSTSHEGQITSIEAQRTHFEDLIRSNDDWELADIYYETGVTGTRKEIRPELNRMMTDCRLGKIDLIITKSISRFARNTSDCLEMVRSLTGLGVHIYFEKENIHTDSMESELLLTILSSLAEEESRSISGNEKWSVHKRFETGTFHYSKVPYGYRLQDKRFEVVEDQAETVRWIFHAVLEGKGTSMIAKELNERGVPACTVKRDGSPGEWTASRIQNMITNISYTGDVILQKTFKIDRKKRMINYGDRPQYYVENHHEAIIEKSVFEKVQTANRQRGREKNNIPPEDRRSRSSLHHNRTCLSGRVFCGNCGCVMKRQTQKLLSGKRYHWLCSGHLADIALCGQKRVMEDEIQNTFMTMLNKLCFAGELIVGSFIEEVQLIEQTKYMEQSRLLNDRLQNNIAARQRLSGLMAKEHITPVYQKQMMIGLENEAAQIREELTKINDHGYLTENAREFRQFLDEWSKGGCYEFPSEAFEKFVEKVVIYAGMRFVFHLKCGLVFAETITEEENN